MTRFCVTKVSRLLSEKTFDVFITRIHLPAMCSTPFYCRMRMRYHGTRLGVWLRTALDLSASRSAVPGAYDDYSQVASKSTTMSK